MPDIGVARLLSAFRRVIGSDTESFQNARLDGHLSLMDKINNNASTLAVATTPAPFVANVMGYDAATTFTAMAPLVLGAMALEKNVGKLPINPILAYTLVAFASSAPELASSISAGIAGEPGLGIGNVIGSNNTNIMLVAGAGMLIAQAQKINKSDVGIHNYTALAASVAFVGLIGTGNLNKYTGASLAAAALTYTGWNVFQEIMHENDQDVSPRIEFQNFDFYEEFCSVFINGRKKQLTTIVDSYYSGEEQKRLYKDFFNKRIKYSRDLSADEKTRLGKKLITDHETLFAGIMVSGNMDEDKAQDRQIIIRLYEGFLQKQMDIRKLQSQPNFQRKLEQIYERDSKPLRELLEESCVYTRKQINSITEACSHHNFLRVLKETPVLQDIDPNVFKDAEEVSNLYRGFLRQRALAASIQIEAERNEVSLTKIFELEDEIGFEFSKDSSWEACDTNGYGLGFLSFSQGIIEFDTAVKANEIPAGTEVNSDYITHIEQGIGISITDHIKNEIVRYCNEHDVTQEFLSAHINAGIEKQKRNLGQGEDLSPEVIDEFFDKFDMTVPSGKKEEILKALIGTGVGAGSLIIAADLLVEGGLGWSSELDNVDPETIGLVVVAIGTSLPEFAFVVTNTIKNKNLDALWGVVLGSNTFNALAVGSAIGFTANNAQVEEFMLNNSEGLAQAGILTAASLAMFAIAKSGQSRRSYGAALLGAFGAYTAFNVINGGGAPAPDATSLNQALTSVLEASMD